ncbi:hypothetical protein [Pseudogemmobacter humi]|uniref:Uncharacterized protein n=1 Tax=Pseudogemmobacter humi TaxID=2483812 RepID=A0A3P5XQ60_9RHOB|nr:hypothetical protein [Pseudogemmobacter humi]VDC32996.1 hypothetical protein XINFAN_03544 [Pseudogemmobacter humi]
MEHPKILWDSTGPDKRRVAEEKLEKTHSPDGPETDGLHPSSGGQDAPPAPEN